MENLLDIENRKTSKKKLYFQLILLIGIIVISIDDIIENTHGAFVYYYLIVLVSLGLLTLVSYLINFKNRNYFDYSVSLFTIFWLLSSPFKYSYIHEHSGIMYYFQLTVGGIFLIALLYALIKYKKFINQKPLL